MPNFLDCPREIRDSIYSKYFWDVLKEDPTAPVHTCPLLRSSRAIAVEAIEAAKPILAKAIMITRILSKLASTKALEIAAEMFRKIRALDFAGMEATREQMRERESEESSLQGQLSKQQRIAEELGKRLEKYLEKGA